MKKIGTVLIYAVAFSIAVILVAQIAGAAINLIR